MKSLVILSRDSDVRNVRIILILSAVVILMAASCSPRGNDNRSGEQNVRGEYTECYRLLLDGSTQTVEGRAIQVPIAVNGDGTWIIQTRDGVAYVRQFSKYIDGYIKLDCSVLDW